MPRLLCCLVLALPFLLQAEDIVFPPALEDVKVITVTRHGVKGDGVTDDTAALQRCVDEHKGRNRTLYFPNGTYLISGPLGLFGGKAHSSDRFITYQGQSERGTVIRVQDRSPAFADPQKPGYALSVYHGDSTGDCMHGYVRNLTVDTGSGNPGAVGIRFFSNNTGAIEHVTIRSGDGQGVIGLDMSQSQNGPCLATDIEIRGFDHGIRSANTFSLVFEHIDLAGQRVAGFASDSSRLTIRDLRSANTVPALVSRKWTHLTLVDAQLTGGAADQTAIVIENESPKAYLRDVRVAGYGRTLVGTYAKQPELRHELTGDVAEWHDGPATVLADGAKPASLRLEPRETPEVPWETDPAKWIVFLAQDGDVTADLQAAIDAGVAAGCTTLALVGKDKKAVITRTIRIHGTINRVIGMSSLLDVRDPHGHFKGGANPVFSFEDLRAEALVVERYFLLGGWDCPTDAVMFANRSGKTIIVKNVSQRGLTKHAEPGGTWFFEDYSPSRQATLQVGKGERVYARQFNPESPENPMIDVAGGQLWLLGLKTEGRATHCIARDGARVEILGGVCYQSWGKQPVDPPVLVVRDASLSATFGFYHHKTPFTTIIEETQGGQTWTRPREGLPGYHLYLYRSGGP